MKKMLIGLLMLAVATGAFAQVTVAGSAQMDLGLYNTPPDNAGWYWDFLNNGGTFIQANAEVGQVKAWARLRGDTVFMGDVTANFDSVALSIGHNRLPVAFWSSYELYGDEHYGIGSSATLRANYIQVKVADSFFIGIADRNYLNKKAFADAFCPIFYLGYKYETDELAAGASFVGVYTQDVFSLMANANVKFSFDPLSVGVNVAFYNAPTYGPFTLLDVSQTNLDHPLFAAIESEKSMALEALVNLGVALDPVDLGFAAGLVVNLGERGGMGVKLGLSATFDLGSTGFTLVPGVGYTLFTEISNPGGLGGVTPSGGLDAGLSFMYSF